MYLISCEILLGNHPRFMKKSLDIHQQIRRLNVMRLKITRFGTDAEGIELSGNPKSCEPDHVRIVFPGGWVEVTRATDGKNPDYWVHVGIRHPKDGMHVEGEFRTGKLDDARLDIHGMHSSDVDTGDFENPNLYHAAFRVKPNWEEVVDGI